MYPCLYISADFGLVKFRHSVDSSIEEDVSIPGAKSAAAMTLYLGVELSHLRYKFIL